MADQNAMEIDTDLTSRQIATLGLDAMTEMAKSSVFLSGLDGLGVDTAKSVALAGVKKLTLHDTKPTTWLDLSTQFYLTPADIGRNRAQVSGPKIAELNRYTSIEVATDDLNSVDLSYFLPYKLVCLISPPLDLAVRVNEFCRKNGIRFIMAGNPGLFGYVFCDFGESFKINDPFGTVLKELIILDIKVEKDEIHVHCDQNQKHDLFDGSVVRFTEVQGMVELNDQYEFQVQGVGQYVFKLTGRRSIQSADDVDEPVWDPIDPKAFSPYLKGGIVLEQKLVVRRAYRSLAEELKNPTFAPEIMDFTKLDSEQLVLALVAQDHFIQKHGSLPKIWNDEDANQFVEIVNSLNEKKLDVDEKFFRQISFTSQGQSIANTAFLGGLLAQEILIGTSGKFSPVNQWAFNDIREIVPAFDSPKDLFVPKNERIDAQRVLFGTEICQKLAKSSLFMIGTGAIGCEMLKNYAMLGVATEEGALITVTDNDIIEKSNLNRQFLFRAKDIGQPKSLTAASAVQQMNPHIKVKAFNHKVCDETEEQFPDEFFSKQDCIVNALDNVDARVYVDSRCLQNSKPLLESGTEGLKGHVQVFLPFITDHYEKDKETGEESFPYCTVKHFPNRIVHCIQWAREKFRKIFEDVPNEVSQFLINSKQDGYWEKFQAKPLEKAQVKKMFSALNTTGATYQDCIHLAKKKFYSFFRNDMIQLFFNYPLDKMEGDKLFWSPPRRIPEIHEFNCEKSDHFDFVFHMSCLYAKIFKIEDQIVTDPQVVKKMIDSVSIPDYVIKKDKVIVSDEKVSKEEAASIKKSEWEEGEWEATVQKLKDLAQKNIQIQAEEFEKDHDENHHIDWITAASNLRGAMYAIKPASRIETKKIAGKIIPAMATSTSAVAGLVSAELVKVLAGFTTLETFKNSWNLNLAVPSLVKSEPGTASGVKVSDKLRITCWTRRFEVKKGDIAIGSLLKYFEVEYGIVVTSISFRGHLIWSNFSASSAANKKFKLFNRFIKTPFAISEETQSYVDLVVGMENKEGEEVKEPPHVRYFFRL